jgi:hypothetical protein
MQKKLFGPVGLCVLAATILPWGVPGVSTGEDFLEKLKKAAEEAAKQRQQRQQQQPQTGQQRQSQTPQQRSQAQQPAQQPPRNQPGGGARLANEKPQPSPDFGTPEGTAKIAAKAGFLEVVGIKLGMPLKEAVDALKAHNAAFRVTPLTLYEYEALPGVIMTPVHYAPHPGGPRDPSTDEFNLLVTYAPNEAFVWGIVRKLGFGTEATRPPLDKTLAGLRQKYGPESAKQADSRLIWIYDAQGKQVMGQPAMDIYNICSQTWMVGRDGNIGGNNPSRSNQYSNSWFDHQLQQGYYWGSGQMGSPGGVCHTHSAIDVYYTHAIPAGSAADLMMNMTMGVFNRQLEASGVTASHANLMAEVGKLNEQRRKEESKRGGMDF